MSNFSLEREITFLKNIPEVGPYLGDALRRIQEAILLTGKNTGTDPHGTLPPPPVIQNLDVKTDPNGLVHAVINDGNEVNRGVHYFVEYSTDKAFSKPHVVHLGASRSMQPLILPSKDDNGNPQTFYFRAYSQYPGSHPNTPVHFGGTTPTPVTPGGNFQMTLIPSTGSGTAQNSGEQGGSGFGRVLTRPAQGPKRISGL